MNIGVKEELELTLVAPFLRIDKYLSPILFTKILCAPSLMIETRNLQHKTSGRSLIEFLSSFSFFDRRTKGRLGLDFHLDRTLPCPLASSFFLCSDIPIDVQPHTNHQKINSIDANVSPKKGKEST